MALSAFLLTTFTGVNKDMLALLFLEITTLEYF